MAAFLGLEMVLGLRIPHGISSIKSHRLGGQNKLFFIQDFLNPGHSKHPDVGSKDFMENEGIRFYSELAVPCCMWLKAWGYNSLQSEPFLH